MSFSKVEILEIMETIFSEVNGKKLHINNRKETGEFTYNRDPLNVKSKSLRWRSYIINHPSWLREETLHLWWIVLRTSKCKDSGTLIRNLVVLPLGEMLWHVNTSEENMCPSGFAGSASGKEPACQCRRLKRCRFYPWLGKIPWSRKWQPTLVFLPGDSNGQGSLVSYSPQCWTEAA